MLAVSGKGLAAWQAAGNGGQPLRTPLLISAGGHACLVGIALFAALIRSKPLVWGEGSGGGAATVRLVSAASVPLPAPTVSTKNTIATEEPGLHYTEPPKPESKTVPAKTPPQKPPVPEKAIELPGRAAKKVKPPARPRLEASLRKPEPGPPAGNEIPYGRGGPVQGPYGMFQSEAGSGGFRISGGAGDFDTRYGWYVTAMRNRISSNWLKGTVDPSIRVAPRVYLTFQILRDGRIVNTQLTASSGIASMDRSALRAIYDSSPMPPLPSDYPGSSVAVEFWFDLRR